MGTILAIDPGKVTGVAVIQETSNGQRMLGGFLTSAGLCHGERDAIGWIEETAPLCNHVSRRDNPRPCGDCVIEVPQVYRADLSKGDPSDLIDLAVMVGRYAATAERLGFAVHLVRPRMWKGQLPKDVCWRRVKETLTPAELATVKAANAPASLAHNMHDAIGLATWFQGRWR